MDNVRILDLVYRLEQELETALREAIDPFRGKLSVAQTVGLLECAKQEILREVYAETEE